MNLPGETAIRIGCFAGVLAVMAVWELIAPWRPLFAGKPLRWLSNLALVVLNTLLVRLLMPTTALVTAIVAAREGWGLLRQIELPGWLVFLAAIVALDFAIYLQHVLFHAVPLFWRMHLVHHADLDIDVTTGLRFHTFEILLSALIKVAVVAALGPPVAAVLAFEVLLNATSMFNHANVRLPRGLDRILRLVLVTPDMHRVHHSVVRGEMNSNFGFNLPWWDYLLGTYRAQPAAGHDDMQIGLSHLQNERQVDRLPGMLLLPFHSRTGGYSLRREDETAPRD
jgi:sterol desaturase/sphingolipid hydroxylase (fatty acid hydroxylase superfamily)